MTTVPNPEPFSPPLRVLVVEDDPVTSLRLYGHLEAAGFAVECAATAREARERFAEGRHEVLLLDIHLPDETGLDLAREFQGDSNAGIIFVTVRDEEMDRLSGLELGADDYITKPYNPRELIARVRNLGRRVRRQPQPGTGRRWRRFGKWSLDLWGRRLYGADGAEVRLTRGEYDLLLALVDNAGKVMAREQLLELTGSTESVNSDRAVDSMVRRLRRKLEADTDGSDLITTVYGVGYIFSPQVV